MKGTLLRRVSKIAAVGVVSAALALTRDYVASRQQFGRPLAAFQAVAQQIADVYIASRTLDVATWSGIWRQDGDLAVAAYWLTEEAPKAMQVCHHLHGGLGVDVTYPMHRYYSMTKDLVRFLGGAEHRLGELTCTSS